MVALAPRTFKFAEMALPGHRYSTDLETGLHMFAGVVIGLSAAFCTMFDGDKQVRFIAQHNASYGRHLPSDSVQAKALGIANVLAHRRWRGWHMTTPCKCSIVVGVLSTS
jgi:hypothetical protein